jgi:hypothetical protein
MAAEVVLQTLKQVWLCLEPLGLPIALMGGLSAAVWKHPRATRDVDILVNLGKANEDLLLPALERAGLRAKRKPPVLNIGPSRILQMLFEPPGTFLEIQVDLLFADSDYQRQALSHCARTRLPGLEIEISVLSCEDLIMHKLLAGRLLDKADAVALVRANREALNFTYLREWIGKLALGSEWAEVWNNAFPGEPPPAGP